MWEPAVDGPKSPETAHTFTTAASCVNVNLKGELLVKGTGTLIDNRPFYKNVNSVTQNYLWPESGYNFNGGQVKVEAGGTVKSKDSNCRIIISFHSDPPPPPPPTARLSLKSSPTSYFVVDNSGYTLTGNAIGSLGFTLDRLLIIKESSTLELAADCPLVILGEYLKGVSDTSVFKRDSSATLEAGTFAANLFSTSLGTTYTWGLEGSNKWMSTELVGNTP
jgi:hypothetical protein